MLGKLIDVNESLKWNALQYIHYAGIVDVDPECELLIVGQET